MRAPTPPRAPAWPWPAQAASATALAPPVEQVRELAPRSALLLAERAPAAAADGGAALRAASAAAAEAGLTPVLRWTQPHAAPLHGWPADERAAVLALEPGDDPVHSPAAVALAAALQPALIVYLDEHRLRADYPAAVAAPTAWTVLADATGRLHGLDGLDRVVDPARLPEAIAELAAAAPDPSPAVIPAVAPRTTVPGLTSVVVPAWNAWPLTAACLDALERHTGPPVEVIVVDNGSSDATSHALAERDTQVIRNDANRGFAAACNQGIVAARGEFVCLLNNDTEVTDGWLEALQAALAAPATGLVGPRSNEISGLQRIPRGPRLADDPLGAHRWAGQWRAGRARRSWPARRLVGFCLLARRALFEQLGGLDEGFHPGNFEDDELCDRVQAAGLGLRVADDAVVLHHGSATFAEQRLNYAARMRAGARHRALAHGPPPQQRAAVAAVVLSDGETAAALASARSGLAVADAVVVLERGDVAATRLALAGLGVPGVEAAPVDWQDGSAAAEALERLDAATVLVLGAGERVAAPDWGAARAELERLAGQPVEVAVGNAAEVRAHPPTPGAVGAIGGRAPARAAALRLIPCSR